MTPVLTIRDMRISVGDDAETGFTLDIPSLDLGAGDCVALTGPSGCGKSTLIEVIALFRRADVAKVFDFHAAPDQDPIDLRAPQDWSRLRQGPIGYVPQSGGVLPFLTAKAQIESVLRLAGVARSARLLARRASLTETLGLFEHLPKRRAELSGGQRKRVALLTGLALPRILLIADEPTAGLDDLAATRVLKLLAGIARTEGTAVLIATHDVEAARAAGFDIAAIRGGVLEPEDAPAKVVCHG